MGTTGNKATGNGRWITVGGKEGPDGKKHGGSPVFVVNGRIVAGAPSLAGRRIDALKEEPELESHRSQLHRERQYKRAKWGKQARKEGIDPKQLHQLAGEIVEHDKAHVEGRKEVLRRARKLLEHYGYHAGALTTNLRSGRVEDKIPGIDVVADSLQRSYPEQFNGYGDAAERLTSMLTEGNPAPVSEDDAYAQALDQLRAEPGRGGDHAGDFDADFNADFNGSEEPVPFGRRGEPERYAAEPTAEDFARHVLNHPYARRMAKRYATEGSP